MEWKKLQIKNKYMAKNLLIKNYGLVEHPKNMPKCNYSCLSGIAW